MALSVFVSCTGTDLDRDLKPAVVEAIRDENQAAVATETWATPAGFAVDVCRRMVEVESTHYMGIFGHWRGWEPQELAGRSITEAEFYWAKDSKPIDHLAVFLPRAGSSIDLELIARVKKARPRQTKEQQAAQERFLAKVKGLVTINVFDSEGQLARKTVKVVERWNGGGLRAIARQAAGKTSIALPRGGVPREPFKPQTRALTAAFDLLDTAASWRPACFAVHGDAGLGHAAAVAQLNRRLEALIDDEPHKLCRIALDTRLRGNDLTTLLGTLATELGCVPAPTALEDFAACVGASLAVQDLLLVIEDVQRFPNGLAGFVETFWAPLVTRLGAAHGHRLLALVSVKPRLADSGLSQAPPAQAGDPFDPLRPAALPPLATVTQPVLAGWLRPRYGDAAEAAAQTLIDETNGLYDLLAGRLAELADGDEH